MRRIPEYEFKVPNDEEGRQFIDLFKKFLNKDKYGYRLRGNAKNRREIVAITDNPSHMFEHIPAEFADEFRVYINPKNKRLRFLP